ncbi:hypothetical protein HF521_001621 [Silurus meridionalis]|uniref:Uncharacterized protein n=1 Tax=Silurus meridionalis TaxID=175797 RepID=A0A8T0BBT0_SILME|nr:hypothetical protein HF521_001621 [Silurus meridionalis]
MPHKNFDILVKEVIKPPSCKYNDFCKAKRVLSELKAEDISDLKQNLLRRLSAYTKNISCFDDNSTSAIEVSFYHLLTNIKLCAQKHYRESCGTYKKH